MENFLWYDETEKVMSSNDQIAFVGDEDVFRETYTFQNGGAGKALKELFSSKLSPRSMQYLPQKVWRECYDLRDPDSFILSNPSTIKENK